MWAEARVVTGPPCAGLSTKTRCSALVEEIRIHTTRHCVIPATVDAVASGGGCRNPVEG